jgi:hypothetical protein
VDDAPHASRERQRCGAEQCAIHIANSAAAADGRFRVILRALVVGLNDWRTGWVNGYHIPRSGMASYRRTRRT